MSQENTSASVGSTPATTSSLSVADVCEAFWKIEREENLYDWEVLGVKLWPLVRFRIFYNLTKTAGVYAWKTTSTFTLPEGYPEHKGKLGYKALWQSVTGWRWHLRKIIPAAWKDPRVAQWHSATDLIAPFSNRNADGIDRFMQPVIDALGDQALRLGVGSYDRKREWPHIDNLQNVFRKKYFIPATLYVRFKLAKADYEKYKRVIDYLEGVTGASAGPYRNFPRWVLRFFLSEKRGYKILFSRLKFKRLFIVNASRMIFMAQAQAAGIKVIELQCGVFSKYNMQFSWPGRPEIPYIPNEIWTWGRYWTEGIENAGGQQIVVSGATDEFEAVRQSAVAKKPNSVSVMSQPLIGKDLFEATVKLAKLLPTHTFIFKPHPKDDLSEFTAGLPSNLSMAATDSTSLGLLAESEITVGVFSASLIEAAGLGNRVAILKLSGWEHLTPLIAGGYASAFETVEEMAAGFETLPAPGDPYFFYGKRVPLQQLLAER
jgi:hypothetical protein